MEGGNAPVAGAEPPGRNGGEGMADRIEGGHAQPDQAKEADHGKANVDLPQPQRGVAHPGGETLTELGARFSAEEGLGAGSNHGKDGNEKHENPHPPQPLGRGAPEKDASGIIFDITHGAGSCGGETGGRFEKCRCWIHRGRAEHVGKGTEGGAQGPTQSNNGNSLAAEDFPGRSASKKVEGSPDHRSDQGGKTKGVVGRLFWFVVIDGVSQTTDHGSGEQEQE